MSLPPDHIARNRAALKTLTDALDELPGRAQGCVELAAEADAALLPVSNGYPDAVRRLNRAVDVPTSHWVDLREAAWWFSETFDLTALREGVAGKEAALIEAVRLLRESLAAVDAAFARKGPVGAADTRATGRAVTAAASRRGSRAHNCDAHATFVGVDGATAAAVVDGIGNSAEVRAMAAVLATVIARIAPRRGCRAALLTGGEVVADCGPAHDSPDAVAVVAVARAGRDTAVGWCGDARIYGFDGERLRQYSTDATVGEQLRRNGVPLELAADHDNWLTTSLSQATVGTVYTAFVPEHELVLLCSDGVSDRLPDGRMEQLVSEHADDVQALADALVNLTDADASGYRDDATVLILVPPP